MNTMFALFDLGGGQILLILALILVFFGARRIPELAKGLGQGIKEFKKATREVTDEINSAADASPPPSQKKLPTNGGQSQPQQTVSQTSDTPKS